MGEQKNGANDDHSLLKILTQRLALHVFFARKINRRFLLEQFPSEGIFKAIFYNRNIFPLQGPQKSKKYFRRKPSSSSLKIAAPLMRDSSSSSSSFLQDSGIMESSSFLGGLDSWDWELFDPKENGGGKKVNSGVYA